MARVAVKVSGVGGANTMNGSENLFFLLRTKKIQYIGMEDGMKTKTEWYKKASITPFELFENSINLIKGNKLVNSRE